MLLVDDVMADGLARQESFHAFAQWKSRSYLERTSEVVVRDWCAYVARLAVLVSPSLVSLHRGQDRFPAKATHSPGHKWMFTTSGVHSDLN